MAYGRKTGGRNFKPGQSGNPNGRPVLPEEIKEARRLNKAEFERILNQYIHMPLEDIKTRASDPTTPALEVLVAKILAEGIKRGDEKRLNFIVDRLVGPVKRKVSLDGGEDGSPIGVSLSKALAEEIEKLEDELPEDERQFE